MQAKFHLNYKKIAYVLKFLLGVLLIYLLINFDSGAELLPLKFFVSKTFLLILVLRLLIVCLLAERWKILVQHQGYYVSRITSFSFSMSGALLSIVLPSVVAFDICRWFGIGNIKNLQNEVATLDTLASIAVTEKIIGLFSLIFLCLMFSGFVFENSLQVVDLLYLCFFILILAVSLRLVAKKLFKIFQVIKWYRLADFVSKTWGGLESLATHNDRTKILLLSLCLHLANAASFAFTAQYIFGSLGFVSDMAVGLLLIFAAIIPVSPGGMGVTEGFSMLIYSVLGSSDGLQYALNFRVVVISCSIIIAMSFFIFSCFVSLVRR
jgi:uncharacterized membrane protein YbhN (UPF0104 family)